MSGHNKWSKIKNQKASTDKEKGKVYTFYARKIAMAVKTGEGLDQALSQAKAASVPKHVIDRALSKNAEGAELKDMLFEAIFFGGKIGLVITAKTDNNTRTSNQLRNFIEKHGGRMVSPGTLDYLFKKQAVIYISKNAENENLVMESAASDFFEEDDEIRIELDIEHLSSVMSFLKSKNVHVLDEEIVYTPLMLANLNEDEKKHLTDLLSSLEEIDDVENVFSNEQN
jgi:YebC/PmpR family DNA-binding regulatory protein